jgi:hypothetical protein
MSDYEFTRGRFNVHYLTAPYDLLVKAFGDDGTVVGRDEWKSMCQWDLDGAEVYDYKVGKCYDSDGLEREQITEWHVQGSDEAIDQMLAAVEGAVFDG